MIRPGGWSSLILLTLRWTAGLLLLRTRSLTTWGTRLATGGGWLVAWVWRRATITTATARTSSWAACPRRRKHLSSWINSQEKTGEIGSLTWFGQSLAWLISSMGRFPATWLRADCMRPVRPPDPLTVTDARLSELLPAPPATDVTAYLRLNPWFTFLGRSTSWSLIEVWGGGFWGGSTVWSCEWREI